MPAGRQAHCSSRDPLPPEANAEMFGHRCNATVLVSGCDKASLRQAAEVGPFNRDEGLGRLARRPVIYITHEEQPDIVRLETQPPHEFAVGHKGTQGAGRIENTGYANRKDLLGGGSCPFRSQVWPIQISARLATVIGRDHMGVITDDSG